MTSTNLSQIPLLTFNSLHNLQREEKRNTPLQKLTQLFYEALDKFLKDKVIEIKKYKEANDVQNFQKSKLILKNSLKISKELMNLRCTKIANIAIKNELFEEEILSTDNVLEKELLFLESIKKATSKIK